MPRKGDRKAEAPDMAHLISRQIRRAENARFLRRLPGFELRRDMPDQWLDLLRKLQEAEATSRRLGIRRGEPRMR